MSVVNSLSFTFALSAVKMAFSHHFPCYNRGCSPGSLRFSTLVSNFCFPHIFRRSPRWSAAQPNTRQCLFNNRPSSSVNSQGRAALTKHDSDRHADLTDILRRCSNSLSTNTCPSFTYLDSAVNGRKQYVQSSVETKLTKDFMWMSCILSHEST